MPVRALKGLLYLLNVVFTKQSFSTDSHDVSKPTERKCVTKLN